MAPDMTPQSQVSCQSDRGGIINGKLWRLKTLWRRYRKRKEKTRWATDRSSDIQETRANIDPLKKRQKKRWRYLIAITSQESTFGQKGTCGDVYKQRDGRCRQVEVSIGWVDQRGKGERVLRTWLRGHWSFTKKVPPSSRYDLDQRWEQAA